MHVAPGLPAVDGYGGELNQVWANLLDNAIDAALGGHVRLDAGSENGKVIVRVIDDGPGIPDEIVNRIFDPFFTTKDVGRAPGSGSTSRAASSSGIAAQSICTPEKEAPSSA